MYPTVPRNEVDNVI